VWYFDLTVMTVERGEVRRDGEGGCRESAMRVAIRQTERESRRCAMRGVRRGWSQEIAERQGERENLDLFFADLLKHHL
jgi:hypothetical protein